MRPALLALPALPWLLALASCSTPPKPPQPDEATRRPVNAQTAIELQACRHELHNTRILMAESERVAEMQGLRLAQVSARLTEVPSAHTTAQAPADAPEALPNTVYTLRFAFGSTQVRVPTDLAAALTAEARTAPLVVLRGRTDGQTDTLAESRIARDRAAAVRDLLVAAGVDPARIRTTHQPTGDHIADNTTASGRHLNRRVEVELYRQRPVAVGATPPQP